MATGYCAISITSAARPIRTGSGQQDVERFLSHLATEGQVSASTQRQALNALVFLYRDVLHQPLEREIAPVRSKRQPRPPTVLTQAEVQRLLAAMTGRHALMARLLYGSGLRLLECIRLRIQDVDFGQHLIVVRGGKGGQDRTTILPRNLGAALQAQIEAVKALHHQDLEEGFGDVYIPEALARTIPKGRAGDRLALGVSCPCALPGPALGQGDAPSRARIRPAKGGETSHSSRQGSTRRSAAIPCATVLRPICWSTGSTSACSRNCSAMQM